MTSTRAKIEKLFPKIMFNEELSKYCTFRIGGPADYFYKAKKTQKLIEVVNFANDNSIPFFIMGGGSNILFDDKGYRGIIIKNETDEIKIEKDTVTADSGVLVSQLIKASIENGLTGLEKWVGLPGTVGGAVRGNAGCNGLETKEILEKVILIDTKTGKTRQENKNYFKFEYRTSKIKKSKEIILSATFKLKKGKLDKEKQKEIINEVRRHRQTTQPFGASSGSFFKNPSPENPAGMLIDKAGLKGTKIGNAQISEKHGNFFLNLGGATSSDILALARLAKAKVKEKFNIELQEEVAILQSK